jgi:hypothetical protein
LYAEQVTYLENWAAYWPIAYWPIECYFYTLTMQVIEFYEISIHVCRKRHKFKYYICKYELNICKINAIDLSTKLYFHSTQIEYMDQLKICELNHRKE